MHCFACFVGCMIPGQMVTVTITMRRRDAFSLYAGLKVLLGSIDLRYLALPRRVGSSFSCRPDALPLHRSHCLFPFHVGGMECVPTLLVSLCELPGPTPGQSVDALPRQIGAVLLRAALPDNLTGSFIGVYDVLGQWSLRRTYSLLLLLYLLPPSTSERSPRGDRATCRSPG